MCNHFLPCNPLAHKICLIAEWLLTGGLLCSSCPQMSCRVSCFIITTGSHKISHQIPVGSGMAETHLPVLTSSQYTRGDEGLGYTFIGHIKFMCKHLKDCITHINTLSPGTLFLLHLFVKYQPVLQVTGAKKAAVHFTRSLMKYSVFT